MSVKISVVTLSLALMSLLCCSCVKTNDSEFCSVFEGSFSAEISVKSEESEYEATITLASAVDNSVQDEKRENQNRDGNVVYSYPETVSGISAVRVGGEVSVNVCGIDIRPSQNIARKYTLLIDMADIRASSVERIEYKEYDGRACAVLYVNSADELSEVYIDRESKAPLLIKNDNLSVTFKSFTKL